LEIVPLSEKTLNRFGALNGGGGDGSPQRRPNWSLRATESRAKTRAKNRGRARINPVEERGEATTVG